jgi:HEAT repeats
MGLFGRPDIAKLKSKGDIVGLIEALGHEDPSIRSKAASALAETGDRRAIEPLLAATKDSNPMVALAVLEALAGLPSPTGEKVWPDGVSLVVFRRGTDEPAQPLQYCRTVLAKHYGERKEKLNRWQVIGLREAVGKQEAMSLYSQLVYADRLADQGTMANAFEGKGPDGREIVALFFE